MIAVEQAVILCGGIGARLRPLTDRLPKPMVPVNGKPFLSHLIQQLREQGIRRVLLLTGYRGEAIREHFGTGGGSGVEVAYAHGPVEWETGRRIWEARAALDARFLLLYSDNYVPFSLEMLLRFHEDANATISLLLHPKAGGNARVDEDGLVAAYDPTRTAPGLDHVEIGYMVIDRDRMLSHLDQPDASFSRVLARLAAVGELAGVVTGDRYHSISDIERWRLMEEYLAHKRILLIDRDGTINQRPPRGEYVSQWSDFQWIDETVDAMQQLAACGFKFIVISNQAGIARGMQNASTVNEINSRLIRELATRGVDVLGVYVCPHHWDEGCSCRKPAAGLFFQCSREHLVRLDRTIYIGDDPRDCLAAVNARCLSILIGPERHADAAAKPALAAATLGETVPWIVKRFEAWESA